MSEARTDRTRMWVSLAIAVLVAATVAIGIWALTGRDDASSSPATPTVTAGDDCGGVAYQYIELNRQWVDPPRLLCFDIDENSEITVGVAALDPEQAISFHVRDTAGGILAQAASAPGIDPQIALVLAPGRYVLEVFGADGAAPPPFLVHTATFATSASPDTPGAEQAELPDIDQCGQDLPWLVDDEPLTRDDDDRYACVRLDHDSMVKVGAIGADAGDDTDLRLTLYTPRGAALEPVATNDDVFGFDPEVSAALNAGIYLVAVDAWFDAATGDFQLYVDTDGDHWRRGEPSTRAADLSPRVCSSDSVTTLTPGQLATIQGGTPLCLAVDAPQRLLLEAASVDGQQIVIEVLGFAADGSPERLAWTSTDPAQPDAVDAMPAVDTIFPAEPLAVIVYPLFGGGDTGEVDIRLVAPEQ